MHNYNRLMYIYMHIRKYELCTVANARAIVMSKFVEHYAV